MLRGVVVIFVMGMPIIHQIFYRYLCQEKAMSMILSVVLVGGGDARC
jgi:hypothetical protein